MLCIQYLNGSKKCSYNDIYVNHNDFFEISAQKVLQNFECKRGEPIFQVWGGGEKGESKFPQILRRGQSLTHYVFSKTIQQKHVFYAWQ